MQELDFHGMWFQQDDATCHTVREATGVLRNEFGEHCFTFGTNWAPNRANSRL